MDRVILDNLSFQLDLPQLLQLLHVRERSKQIEEVRQLAERAQAIGQPKALYKVVYIESRGPDHVVVDGTKFTSRVLRMNLERAQRAFAFICTAGRELESWAESYDDMLQHYYADAISEAVLHAARATLNQHLEQRYAVKQIAEMSPGSLEDWPLREQRPLFALLGDTQASIGVELTDSLLMVPAKTVSGFLFPTEETFASCQLCPRVGCPNRKAPYDPELFEQRYRETAG